MCRCGEGHEPGRGFGEDQFRNYEIITSAGNSIILESQGIRIAQYT